MGTSSQQVFLFTPLRRGAIDVKDYRSLSRSKLSCWYPFEETVQLILCSKVEVHGSMMAKDEIKMIPIFASGMNIASLNWLNLLQILICYLSWVLGISRIEHVREGTILLSLRFSLLTMQYLCTMPALLALMIFFVGLTIEAEVCSCHP